LGKHDQLKEEYGLIENFVRGNDGVIPLSHLSQLLRESGKTLSRKTMYLRLKKMQDMNRVYLVKRGKQQIVILKTVEYDKILLASVHESRLILERVKSNYDKIAADRIGIVLPALLMSLTSDKYNISVQSRSAPEEYRTFIKAAVDAFDIMIRDAHEFIEEKCGHNIAMVNTITLNLADISNSLFQHIAASVPRE
jgi:hypothetical protein